MIYKLLRFVANFRDKITQTFCKHTYELIDRLYEQDSYYECTKCGRTGKDLL